MNRPLGPVGAARALLVLSLLVVLPFAGGSSAAAKVWTESSSPLSRQVVAALESASLHDSARVAVHDRDGVIVLTGRVQTLAERERVASLAEGVAGVRAVEPRVVARPVAPVPDAELQAAAEAALRAATFQTAGELYVDALSGRVRLYGVVQSPGDKYTAQDAVKEVPGITVLSNELQVRPKLGRRQVEVELFELLKVRDLDIDKLRIVEVGGVVMIDGRTHDVLTRETVEAFIAERYGAQRLINRVKYVLAPGASEPG